MCQDNKVEEFYQDLDEVIKAVRKKAVIVDGD